MKLPSTRITTSTGYMVSDCISENFLEESSTLQMKSQIL